MKKICPKCEKVVDLDDGSVGKAVLCPNCFNVFLCEKPGVFEQALIEVKSSIKADESKTSEEDAAQDSEHGTDKEIKCPKCGKDLWLPEKLIGTKVQCPFCDEKFVGGESTREDGARQPVTIETKPKPQTPKEDPQYILPQGALWEDLRAYSSIPPYSDLFASGGPSSLEVECEKCKGKLKVAFRSMIDLSDEPRYKSGIISGDIYKFKCPHCGNHQVVIYKTYVYSQEKSYFIRTVFDTEAVQKLHQKSSLDMEGMGWDHDSAVNCRERIVWRVPGLMEKVRIFEEGMDDYGVEFLKLIVRSGLDARNMAYDEIHYEGRELDQVKFCVTLKDGRTAHTAVPYNKYAELMLRLKSAGKIKEGILRFVNWRIIENSLDDWFEQN